MFGYGSLIWNPGFDYWESLAARLEGSSLRFWQASEDHRGTPEFPGRVATLVKNPEGEVWGRVFRVRGEREQVLAYLDDREKFGYERHFFTLRTVCGRSLTALSYVGSPSLTSFVGPECESETASVILKASGPSGANLEYLRRLHQSLTELGRVEPHVERLFRLVENTAT